jgi:presenilin-like A22 family membrane protease
MRTRKVRAEHLSLVCMAVFILLIQVFAVLMAEPFEAQEIKAFEDPEAVSNLFIFICAFLAFTLFFLIIIKLEKDWVIHLFILASVALTMFYVFIALFPSLLSLSLTLTIALTFLLYKYPEWYVIDAIAVIIGIGAASIFGISLDIRWAFLLLVILAVYDFIAVYKTKHMISLAEGVMEMKIPVLFVIPRKKGCSFLKSSKLDEGDAYFMGLGDAVIPAILVVSANSFSGAPSIAFINAPALGAIIGTLAGYAILATLIGKGKPHAGLPFLNSGAIIGFLIASVL